MAIIIAHRLSTVRLCDEIIVIDNGRIVERGSHNELMKKKGLYSSFYRMQFREEQGIEIQETHRKSRNYRSPKKHENLAASINNPKR